MNLLPITEKNDLKKGLKLRFIIIFLSFLILSFFIGLIMLLPSFLLSRAHSFETKKNDFAKMEDSKSEILDIPKEIDLKLKFFESNNVKISIVDVFSNIIKQMGSGVTLDAISFSRDGRPQDKKGVRILVSGVALSRDSLLAFSNLLKESKDFYSVDIPVSSFSKDKNLSFSINMFIKNQE